MTKVAHSLDSLTDGQKTSLRPYQIGLDEDGQPVSSYKYLEEKKSDGWHVVHPHVEQLWLNGKHIGSVSWTIHESIYEGITLDKVFPIRERADFASIEEAKTFVEEKTGYSLSVR